MAFDILFLLACVGLILHGINSGQRPPMARRAVYSTGDLASFPGIDFGGFTETFVIYATKGCCADELTAYADLSKHIHTVFLTSSRSGLTLGADELKRYGFGLLPIIPVHIQSTKFADAPTALIVDKTGRIQHVWRGKLNPTARKEVVQADSAIQDLGR